MTTTKLDKIFTFEESRLIALCYSGSRQQTISALRAARRDSLYQRLFQSVSMSVKTLKSLRFFASLHTHGFKMPLLSDPYTRALITGAIGKLSDIYDSEFAILFEGVDNYVR
jgi:hypothetical protein